MPTSRKKGPLRASFSSGAFRICSCSCWLGHLRCHARKVILSFFHIFMVFIYLWLSPFMRSQTNGPHRRVHWIAPCIGLAIAICGLQVVTTVLTSYCVDCYSSRSSAVAQFISFVRQVISFTVPFWNPPLNARLGYGLGFGVEAIIVVAFYILVCGTKHREKGKKTSTPSLRLEVCTAAANQWI